jgi:hypothetical protein
MSELQPKTRQQIIWVIGAIVFVAILAEIVLTMFTERTSEALLSIASVGVGALAGALLPNE